MSTIIFRLIRYTLFVMVLAFCSSGNPAESRNPPELGTLDVDIVRSPSYLSNKELKERVFLLFHQKKWDELEKLAEQCQKNTDRRPQGWSKLENFYTALDSPDRAFGYEKQFALLDEWIKAKPDSVAAPAVKAINMNSYAWDARGIGWSSSVTEEGWQLMGQRLEKARQMLEQLRKEGKYSPGLYAGLMTVSLGQSWERKANEELFAEATKRYPDYWSYYFQMGNWLAPKWHGNSGDREEFSKRSADRIGGSEGDILYARMAWDMGPTQFKQYNMSWDRVKKGFDALLEKYPDSDATTIKSGLARLAVAKGDNELAARLFDELGNKVARDVWTKGRFFKARKNAYEGAKP